MGFTPSYKVGVEFINEPYRSVIQGLRNALISVWGDNLVSLVVFGSVARGDARRDSDVDLLIVGKQLPKSRFKRLELSKEAALRLVGVEPPKWYDVGPALKKEAPKLA